MLTTFILTSYTQAQQIELATNKINLVRLEKILKLFDKSKFDSGIYSYSFSIPDTPKHGYSRFEAHGQFAQDLDKVVITCRRFSKEGKGEPYLENIASPCGKIYSQALSVFTPNYVDLTSYLMSTAREMGKPYSMSQHKTQDLLFEFGNDGILIIRRASRKLPKV